MLWMIFFLEKTLPSNSEQKLKKLKKKSSKPTKSQKNGGLPGENRKKSMFFRRDFRETLPLKKKLAQTVTVVAVTLRKGFFGVFSLFIVQKPIKRGQFDVFLRVQDIALILSNNNAIVVICICWHFLKI